jgi:putative transposase/transposase-like zinc-binding protein
MLSKQPLKQILTNARELWNHTGIRESARQNFHKVVVCRTAALGAEVFASDTEEKVFFHSCKSRSCPSCGHRATILWQREQWASLPDVPYRGIVFTMPDVLWPIFRNNRRLLHDLPVLGAEVIQQWVKAKYGVRVLLMVVPHTFGRHLTFNCHLHILVSAGGLKESEVRWIEQLRFDKNALMHMWRFAVITYLRAALQATGLKTDMSPLALKELLETQYGRLWNINIDHFKSKAQFLRYAGRYVRRPPIAQRRFVTITNLEVTFWTKDLRQKRIVVDRYSIEEFLANFADQVPDRYRHAIRYFGLLAPATKRATTAALFTLLKQKKRPRPIRLSWRASIQKDFGRDPLLDTLDRTMRRIGRRAPVQL